MRRARIFPTAILATLAAALALLPARSQEFSDVEFLSVKTPRANVRENPEEDAPILWRMWRYMPLEVIGYRGDWRKIRDLDGDEGWMHKDTLADVPTVMVSVKQGKLRKTRGGPVIWLLDRGYALRIFGVKDDWYEVSDLSSVSGWIHKSHMWGYPPPKERGDKF